MLPGDPTTPPPDEPTQSVPADPPARTHRTEPLPELAEILTSAPPVTVPAAGELVPATAPYGAEPVLARIGPIAVTATTVHTPNGSFPVRGSTWHLHEHLYPTQRTPTWAVTLAIVLTVVFFFCFAFLSLLFLLFLLAKETRLTGYAQVTVTSGPRGCAVQVPVARPEVLVGLHAQVAYVRAIAAA
ncbi:MAG TPA: hypothetical protein VGN37_29965 [Actinocatenispora sp.]